MCVYCVCVMCIMCFYTTKERPQATTSFTTNNFQIEIRLFNRKMSKNFANQQKIKKNTVVFLTQKDKDSYQNILMNKMWPNYKSLFSIQTSKAYDFPPKMIFFGISHENECQHES